MQGHTAPSFPTVEAEYFQKQLRGRNGAVLLGCVSASGDAVTAVVKLHHRVENKESCYWVEWVSGLLAVELGVHVPEQLVVNVDPAVAAVIGEQLGENASSSARPSFGTRYVTPIVQLMNDGRALDEDLREAGAELAAFDAFVDNPDRRANNPNLLIEARSSRRLLAIDHDLAFSGFLTTLIGGGGWPLDILQGHALAGRIGTRKPVLTRMRSAIAQLSDAFLDGLPAAVPPVWLPGSELTKLLVVIEKLKARRDTIASWFPRLEAWL